MKEILNWRTYNKYNMVPAKMFYAVHYHHDEGNKLQNIKI